MLMNAPETVIHIGASQRYWRAYYEVGHCLFRCSTSVGRSQHVLPWFSWFRHVCVATRCYQWCFWSRDCQMKEIMEDYLTGVRSLARQVFIDFLEINGVTTDEKEALVILINSINVGCLDVSFKHLGFRRKR